MNTWSAVTGLGAGGVFALVLSFEHLEVAFYASAAMMYVGLVGLISHVLISARREGWRRRDE